MYECASTMHTCVCVVVKFLTILCLTDQSDTGTQLDVLSRPGASNGGGDDDEHYASIVPLHSKRMNTCEHESSYTTIPSPLLGQQAAANQKALASFTCDQVSLSLSVSLSLCLSVSLSLLNVA